MTDRARIYKSVRRLRISILQVGLEKTSLKILVSPRHTKRTKMDSTQKWRLRTELCFRVLSGPIRLPMELASCGVLRVQCVSRC